MHRKWPSHVMSSRRCACVTPYLLLLPMVLFVGYTLQTLLESGKAQFDSDYFNLQADVPVESPRSENGRRSDQRKLQADFDKARMFVNIYNLSDGYEADFRCVEMKTRPRTPVCVYDSYTDMYISHDLTETGIWEKHVLLDFQEDLKRDDSLGVLDIGANIGVFSLLAANMGRKVVAVEPYKNNILRLHRSAVLAGTTNRILVLENAVSDIRSVATLKTKGNNQGDTRIIMGYEPCLGSCPTKVNTILLSDLRYVMTFSRAIMKIDIQGFEHLAFANIEALLDSVTIPCIYMEWLIMRTHGNSSRVAQQEKVQRMIRVLYIRNYRPYSLTKDGATLLPAGSWHTWPLDIVWRHLPSEKEYRKLIKNHFMIWP